MINAIELQPGVDPLAGYPLDYEPDVDLFAGGGGASVGMEAALGKSPDIAINHDPEALAMHIANHPGSLHVCQDIVQVSPLDATGGRRVRALWASPDCKHFSKAKGGKPRNQFIRDLAWTVVRWAQQTRPKLIGVENVEEFQTWGPLDKAGQPIKSRAGETFREWVRALRKLGYTVAWRELVASDFGAPTTRKRLFVIARLDGKYVRWPKPTHGDPKSPEVQAGRLLPWRTAAECINWDDPAPSIFKRKKPLADNTQRRIAEGIRRYVLQSATPFIVTYYGAKSPTDFRGQSLGQPLRTQTTENRHTLAGLSTAILHQYNGASEAQPLEDPLPTVTSRGRFGLSTALICQFNRNCGGRDLNHPLSTVCQREKHGLVTCGMYAGDHYEKVKAFLRKWGVIGLEDEAEFVHKGVTYRITDIGLRMMRPRELFRAHGFSESYNISPIYRGKPLIITSQTAKCGNSVPPAFVKAVYGANLGALNWTRRIRRVEEMPLFNTKRPEARAV